MQTCKLARLTTIPSPPLPPSTAPPPPIISNQREPAASQSNGWATLWPSGTCGHIEERDSHIHTPTFRFKCNWFHKHNRFDFGKEKIRFSVICNNILLNSADTCPPSGRSKNSPPQEGSVSPSHTNDAARWAHPLINVRNRSNIKKQTQTESQHWHQVT